MQITFLGSGTSAGVPVIGCECEVCTSDHPRNKRTRSSLYVETAGRAFVIDTTPEFRLQMLREGISHLDFILYTHAHADHVLGLDDVRPLNRNTGQAIDCYGKSDQLDVIRQKFQYIFRNTDNPSWKPEVELHPMETTQTIQGVEVTPIPVLHGEMTIYGYRIGPLGYISDVSHVPPASLDRLQGVEVLVLDALRYTDHPTHFTLDQALETAGQIGAPCTLLTHLAHEIDYERTGAELPEGVRLAYDGLTKTIEEDSSR